MELATNFDFNRWQKLLKVQKVIKSKDKSIFLDFLLCHCLEVSYCTTLGGSPCKTNCQDARFFYKNSQISSRTKLNNFILVQQIKLKS